MVQTIPFCTPCRIAVKRVLEQRNNEGVDARVEMIHTKYHLQYPSFRKVMERYASRFDYPKYFLALCRTRVSNTLLLIGVCAVWKGFIIVYEGSTSFMYRIRGKTDLYIQLPNVHEERLDPIIVLPFVQQHEFHIWQHQSVCIMTKTNETDISYFLA